ncbi:MAG: L-serine ammonia-lyase, iron-sulfur-dependent, subunit alpha [Hespellia sp.]|nr:L-serine ammonia-lyase, iron-sulfur-dependent, subunit alpha [Hespellia sp.]
MSFQALEDILTVCDEEKILFWEAVLREDMNDRLVSREDSISKMKEMWYAMFHASRHYDASLKSSSGLVGGTGGQMDLYRQREEPICGDFVAEVMAEALKMGESNACMKRIVAAPTAGACGVIPAVLVPLYKRGQVTEEQVIEALYVTAGIGQVIAERAFIAGATGGCQAEIGSASSMAAGALVYLKGGSNAAIAQGSAMALKNLLGLVCDPVAGLVEVPCVKRNVIGAVNALSSADMALAGIESRIPPDQVIDAMKEIGTKMHVSLRETGEGGVANTPTAQLVRERLEKNGD